jgi:hypothetical protein
VDLPPYIDRSQDGLTVPPSAPDCFPLSQLR